jgi:hypothetical protein
LKEVADMARKQETAVETPATPLKEVADYEILEDFKGSPDGCIVIEFKAGAIMEMPASLAEVAISEGWAKPVESE